MLYGCVWYRDKNVSREDSDPHSDHNMLVHGWPAEAGQQPLVSDAMEHARRSTPTIRTKDKTCWMDGRMDVPLASNNLLVRRTLCVTHIGRCA